MANFVLINDGGIIEQRLDIKGYYNCVICNNCKKQLFCTVYSCIVYCVTKMSLLKHRETNEYRKEIKDTIVHYYRVLLI